MANVPWIGTGGAPLFGSGGEPLLCTDTADCGCDGAGGGTCSDCSSASPTIQVDFPAGTGCSGSGSECGDVFDDVFTVVFDGVGGTGIVSCNDKVANVCTIDTSPPLLTDFILRCAGTDTLQVCIVVSGGTITDPDTDALAYWEGTVPAMSIGASSSLSYAGGYGSAGAFGCSALPDPITAEVTDV